MSDHPPRSTIYRPPHDSIWRNSANQNLYRVVGFDWGSDNHLLRGGIECVKVRYAPVSGSDHLAHNECGAYSRSLPEFLQKFERVTA